MAKVLSINSINIRNKINGALTNKRFIGLATNAANTRFISAQNDMLEEFDNHIVTQELNNDTNPSEIVSKGTLRSFIGFKPTETPAPDLREYLRENVKMNKTPEINKTKQNIVYNFKVKSPSKQDINSNDIFSTPDRWSTRSWIDIVENGINNIIRYIYNSGGFGEKSRSGTGLQLKSGEVKNVASFNPVKYVSEILKNFTAKFRG